MDLKKTLGKNIKQYRLLKGLSQEKFSELLDISQQTLSKIECGKNFLTSETLEKIPNLLGVKIYELFMNSEDEYTANDAMKDIERYLSVLKSKPEKLECIRKIIREITFLS